MTTKAVLSYVNSLGKRVAAGRFVLPHLGIYVAKQALAGRITTADAPKIYEAYSAPFLAFGPITPRSFAAQTSKLRQIIRLVEWQGAKGMRVLESAIKEYAAIAASCRKEKIRKPAMDLYGYMVFAAREELRRLYGLEAAAGVKQRQYIVKGLR